MTKKERKNISGILAGIFAISLFVIQFYIYEMNVYLFLGLAIFGTVVVEVLIFKALPAKKQSKSISSKNAKSLSPTPPKKNLSINELLTADIDTLEGNDFERLVYLYFKAKGFNPESTAKTGDHGVDLVIKDPKDGLKIAVQCKRYVRTKNIGNKYLRELEGGKRFYGCAGTMFITTSDYTPKAREYANQVKMDLWYGAEVRRKIDKWRKAEAKKRNLVS